MTTIDWLGLPEALSWVFIAAYLALGIGIYLNEQLVRWLVDRERRQVALRANYWRSRIAREIAVAISHSMRL